MWNLRFLFLSSAAKGMKAPMYALCPCYWKVHIYAALTYKTHMAATMWSGSLCKQSERREDEVWRGNPLHKCQAVRAIRSPLFLFPLFCTSHGSDSAPSSLLRYLSCGCARASLERWHRPAFCLCATRICRHGRRRMKAGCTLVSEDGRSCKEVETEKHMQENEEGKISQ